MEDELKELKNRFPCRESQIGEILDFISAEDEPVPPCLFVHGSSATGKSTCVNSVLRFLPHDHVIVNAVECYTPKILYETVLNSLSGHRCTSKNKYAPFYKCDNMKDFVVQLNGVFRDHNYRPTIIAIDSAERLRNLDHNILPVLMRLKEFCDLNVCVILISNVIYEKFHIKSGLVKPIKIHFPQYTKDELFKILLSARVECANFVLKKRPVSETIREDVRRADVFANYLNAFLSVFYRPCRDLVELKYMARTNYVSYCEPVLDGSAKVDDVTKLWRNVGPNLKSSLEMLYLRLNTGRDVSRRETENVQVSKSDKTITEELTSTRTFAQNFELPFYAKYLLIAAYLASFNPAKEDKRLFVKYHGKQKKRLQQVNAKAKLSEKLNMQLGPKPFTLDRLLAIFYSIIDERVGLTANLLVQISSLVSLRLLTASADSTKYRCVVGFEFITVVSRMVGFNIKKYLYDLI